jgi:hypothetical protein
MDAEIENIFKNQFTDNELNWLNSFDPAAAVNISELIDNFLNEYIVYYPGSGQDGSAVKFFNEANAATCFLYVDYMMTQEALERDLKHEGFRGYVSIARLNVTERDIGAGKWTQHLSPGEVDYKFQPVESYAFLEILEKQDVKVPGAPRLAILFLSADGHAAYDALFCQEDSGRVPPFCIVAQDHGFGGNWSDFGAGGALETIANRAGSFPKFLLVGNNTNAWRGYERCENVAPAQVTESRTWILYARDTG